MSASITLVGKVDNEPELKFGSSGKSFMNLRVRTEARRLNKETNKWEAVDQTWWSVSVFGKLAENATDAGVAKGSDVVIIGKAKQREWEDKDGNKRTSIDVIADTLAVDLKWSTTTTPMQREKPTEPADDPWTSQSPAAPF
jgi:single-strand DNA-binding protein